MNISLSKNQDQTYNQRCDSLYLRVIGHDFGKRVVHGCYCILNVDLTHNFCQFQFSILVLQQGGVWEQPLPYTAQN